MDINIFSLNGEDVSGIVVGILFILIGFIHIERIIGWFTKEKIEHKTRYCLGNWLLGIAGSILIFFYGANIFINFSNNIQGYKNKNEATPTESITITQITFTPSIDANSTENDLSKIIVLQEGCILDSWDAFGVLAIKEHGCLNVDYYAGIESRDNGLFFDSTNRTNLNEITLLGIYRDIEPDIDRIEFSIKILEMDSSDSDLGGDIFFGFLSDEINLEGFFYAFRNAFFNEKEIFVTGNLNGMKKNINLENVKTFKLNEEYKIVIQINETRFSIFVDGDEIFNEQYPDSKTKRTFVLGYKIHPGAYIHAHISELYFFNNE